MFAPKYISKRACPRLYISSSLSYNFCINYLLPVNFDWLDMWYQQTKMMNLLDRHNFFSTLLYAYLTSIPTTSFCDRVSSNFITIWNVIQRHKIAKMLLDFELKDAFRELCKSICHSGKLFCKPRYSINSSSLTWIG